MLMPYPRLDRAHETPEAYPLPVPKGDEHPTWRDYRRRRAFAVVAFASYLPGGAGLGMLLQWAVGPEYEMIPAVALLAAWIVAVVRLGRFKYPRCARCFTRLV